MAPNRPSPNTPPPLPGEQRSKQASAQVSRTQPDGKKQKPKKRSSLGCLWVLLLLIGGAGYWIWRYQIAQQAAMYGFQPPEMEMARYTPKDVIGALTLPLFRVALNPRFTRPFYAVPRTSAARTASG